MELLDCDIRSTSLASDIKPCTFGRLVAHDRVKYHEPEARMLGEAARLMLYQMSDIVLIADRPLTWDCELGSPVRK